MIIAIERYKFNILYKYDQINVSLNSVIDSKIEDLELMISNPSQFDSLVKNLDRILPVFELDHEVILLDVDKSKINLSGELIIYFNSLKSVYTLTYEGERLLFGKLNENIKIGRPILDKAIQKVKADRTIQNRIKSVKKLIDVFELSVLTDKKFKQLLQTTIDSIVYNRSIDENNILYHLLTYDKTPNFLPTGNAEFITKVGIITLLSINKDESILKNGAFYKQCLEFRDQINKGSFFDGLENFNNLLSNEILKISYDKIIASINPKFDNLDIFKISYYFLAIKSHLNKNEKDLLSIANQLYNKIQEDPSTFIHVLLLIGYTFSFEELYESLHILNKAPILKSSVNEMFKTNTNTLGIRSTDKKLNFLNKKSVVDIVNDDLVDKVSEEISKPILIFENNINKDKNDDGNLNLFGADDSLLNENNAIKDEIYKSVSEIQDWVNNHKTISKNASLEWRKFIVKSLKYGKHSLIDIFTKVKTEKLEGKLTKKMLKELEVFYT